MVLDLKKYETLDEPPKASDPPASSEAEVKAQPTANTTQDASTKDTPTVTLDGPLSKIYAQALVKSLGQNTLQYVGEHNEIESQAAFMLQDSRAPLLNDAVIYVTDQDHLEDDPIATYDTLRVALDKKATRKYVVIEHRAGSRIARHCDTIVRYAKEQGALVFFSRQAFFDAVQ